MLLKHAITGRRVEQMKTLALGVATALLGTMAYVMIGMALAGG
jgi:hypothetical protein